MLEHLQLLIQSGHPILSMETHDERRARELVCRAAEALSLPVFEWSITTGLVQTHPHAAETDAKPGKAGPALEYVLKKRNERAIYLFKDLAPHAREPYIARLLRDLHSGDGATVILVDLGTLPDNVRRLTVPLQLRLPDCEELEQIVRDTFRLVRSQSYYEITHSPSAISISSCRPCAG